MMDFIDFVNILEDCGWGYTNFRDVKNKKYSGTRYTLVKTSPYADSYEELCDKVRNNFDYPEDIITGVATYRYAPEIEYKTLTILNHD